MGTRGARMIQLLKDKKRLEELNIPKYESTKGTTEVEKRKAIEGIEVFEVPNEAMKEVTQVNDLICLEKFGNSDVEASFSELNVIASTGKGFEVVEVPSETMKEVPQVNDLICLEQFGNSDVEASFLELHEKIPSPSKGAEPARPTNTTTKITYKDEDITMLSSSQDNNTVFEVSEVPHETIDEVPQVNDLICLEQFENSDDEASYSELNVIAFTSKDCSVEKVNPEVSQAVGCKQYRQLNMRNVCLQNNYCKVPSPILITNAKPSTAVCSDKESAEHESSVVVKRKRKYNRKNFCIFCFSLCSNFRRHLLRNYQNEMEVAEYLSLLPNEGNAETEESKAKRFRIFDNIRNKGNYQYNQLQLKDLELCPTEEAALLPNRRPKQPKKVDDYVTCNFCKGLFSKNSFRKHVTNCSLRANSDEEFNTDTDNDDSAGPENNIRSRRCSNFRKKYGKEIFTVTNNVSERFKTDIVPMLNKNDAVKAAMKDSLLMSIASDFHSNHLQNKDKYVVSKKIHDGGKLLLNIKQKDPTIKNFEDCFHPMKAHTVLETVKEMCGADANSGNVSIIGMPSRLSWLLNEGASRLLVDTVTNKKLNDEEKTSKKRNVSEFLEVKKRRWKFVVSTNAELSRKRKKMDKPKIMPIDEDVKKLSTYLKKLELNYYEHLKTKPTCENYENLCEVTIAHIITLSRRRPAEAGDALLANYLNRHNKGSFSTIILNTLDTAQQEAMRKLQMFVVPGKNEHEVPILLTEQMVKNIDLLISLRRTLQIPERNKLLFARPGLDTAFSGSKVIGKLVKNCSGLQEPSHLTATGLRHHAASTSQVHGEKFVDHLAKFMGHTPHIHKKNYQLPSQVIQLGVVGREMLAMEGDDVEMEVNQPLTNSDNVCKMDILTNRSRKKWTEEEKSLVINEFKDFLKTKTNPGLPRCTELIQKYEELQGRTAHQINVMIDNINKGKLKIPTHLL